jgi:hypothetical protein
LHHDNVREGDDLLVCRLEIPCLVSLGPEFLDCLHYFSGLIDESLAEINRPGQPGVHFSD